MPKKSLEIIILLKTKVRSKNNMPLSELMCVHPLKSKKWDDLSQIWI